MPNNCAEDMAGVFAPFGDEDWRLCVRDDLGRINAEDAVRQFRQAEAILSGFMQAGDEVSLALYVVLSSAHTLAREARETAEGYVRGARAWQHFSYRPGPGYPSGCPGLYAVFPKWGTRGRAPLPARATDRPCAGSRVVRL